MSWGRLADLGAGNSTWKVEPFPSVDSTQMRPPCISTICLAMASPRPVPPLALVFDGLVGEGLDQGDLAVGEGTHLGAADDDDPKHLAVPHQGHAEFAADAMLKRRTKRAL